MSRVFGIALSLAVAGVIAGAQQRTRAEPRPAAAPSSPIEALLSKARSLEGRGRIDLAAQTWQQVLMANPKQPEALAGMARYSKQAGRSDQEKLYTERLRSIDPKHPALAETDAARITGQQQRRLQEAERLMRSQQPEQAMEIYREVFGDNPPPGGWAIAYYEALASVPGGHESATAGLERLMKQYPESVDYRLTLGRLLTYRQPTRLAGLRLLESVQGNPLATSKAKAAWRQALMWEDQNPAVLPSVRAYLSRYADAELQRIELRLAKAEPPPAVARGSKEEGAGYAALRAGNVALAESNFESILKAEPKNAQGLAGLGFVRMKQEDFAGAEELFASAAEEAPGNKTIAEALETARFWKTMKKARTAVIAGRLAEGQQLYEDALKLRPDNPDALHALAGTYMQSGEPQLAEPILEKLTTQQPESAELWLEAIKARHQSRGPAPALALAKNIPEAAQRQLRSNVEYYAAMAAALSDAGRQPESKRYLQEGIDLANARNRELPLAVQLQYAGLFLRHGYNTEAASLFRAAAAVSPDNVDALQGLMAALVASHDEAGGRRALERASKAAVDGCSTRPACLRSMSSIQMAFGQLDAAEQLLRKSVDLDGAVDTKENVAAQLQLSQIWMRKGQSAAAESLLRRLQADHPDEPDVWKTLIAVVHQRGRNEEALTLSTKLPDMVRTALQEDPDYANILVSALSQTGELEQALRMAQRATSLLQQQNRPVPADLQIQTAWLMLNCGSDQRELYSMLTKTGSRPDLTNDQTQQVQDIWAVWSMRRAEAMAAADDMPGAIAILEQAARAFPKNAKMQAALAGNLLKAGEPKRALAVYLQWGLRGGTASDYAGAIASALSQKDRRMAAFWLSNAMSKWPRDGDLLKLAGDMAAANGDYKNAEAYWRAAANSMRRNDAAARMASVRLDARKQEAPPDPIRGLGELLVGGDVPGDLQQGEPARPKRANEPELTERPTTVLPASRRIAGELFRDEQAPPQPVAHLAQYKPEQGASVLPSPRRTSASADSASEAAPNPPAKALPSVPGIVPDLVETPESKSARSALSEIEDQIAAVSARDTPSMSMGGIVRGRSGEAGYDRLLVQEAEMDASTVLGDRMRVTAIARPTYLDSGAPDGTSAKRFGLMPGGSTFGAQSVGGVGGEVQVSTKTFGFRVGSTPRQFAAANFIGGLRFRPGNGPITILLERDVVRDSMLSFAGTRDPITNRVWGGVVASGASAIGNWGGADSGFYASLGFQRITGTQVAVNQRVDGNFGGYWRVVHNAAGSLTAGFNVSAMHYDKNLRYFTLGQGGYFSPQRYMLFNIPLQWRATRGRLQYVATGSLGSQHFEEDASPYFPTLPVFQSASGKTYPRYANTGANYSVNVQLAYQLTPRWYLGAYVDANNARNYTSQAAGVFLRYTIVDRPLSMDLQVPAIPDWRGTPVFGLQ